MPPIAGWVASSRTRRRPCSRTRTWHNASPVTEVSRGEQLPTISQKFRCAMRRIFGPTLIVALTVATLWFIPDGTAAGRNTRSIVPSGWRTYRYKDLLISVPASWTVMRQAGCLLPARLPRSRRLRRHVLETPRPGVLTLGTEGLLECPLRYTPPHNIVWVLDMPPGDYGPKGPAPYYYPRTETEVNGINVYVASHVTRPLEWYTPGAEEIGGYGPEVSHVLHTIRRAG
jgi:hypothetical protein